MPEQTLDQEQKSTTDQEQKKQNFNELIQRHPVPANILSWCAFIFSLIALLTTLAFVYSINNPYLSIFNTNKMNNANGGNNTISGTVVSYRPNNYYKFIQIDLVPKRLIGSNNKDSNSHLFDAGIGTHIINPQQGNIYTFSFANVNPNWLYFVRASACNDKMCDTFPYIESCPTDFADVNSVTQCTLTSPGIANFSFSPYDNSYDYAQPYPSIAGFEGGGSSGGGVDVGSTKDPEGGSSGGGGYPDNMSVSPIPAPFNLIPTALPPNIKSYVR